LAFYCPFLAESETGKISLGQWKGICSQIIVSHRSELGFPRDGGHFMVFDEQHTRRLFERLSEYLDELESGEMNADGGACDRIATGVQDVPPDTDQERDREELDPVSAILAP
jgi:hypothetical protein